MWKTFLRFIQRALDYVVYCSMMSDKKRMEQLDGDLAFYHKMYRQGTLTPKEWNQLRDHVATQMTKLLVNKDADEVVALLK